MSRLRTYHSPQDEAIVVLGTKSPCVNSAPGILVQHRNWPGTFGIMLANMDDAVLILWSREPGILAMRF